MPQTRPSSSQSSQRPAGTSASRPPRCGRPWPGSAPVPGLRGVPPRRRRDSGVPGGVDLGPFVALSGLWSCSPIALHPRAPRASLTRPDRNPTASPTWSRSWPALPRRRRPGAPACPPRRAPAHLAQTRRRRGAVLLPVRAPSPPANSFSSFVSASPGWSAATCSRPLARARSPVSPRKSDLYLSAPRCTDAKQ